VADHHTGQLYNELFIQTQLGDCALLDRGQVMKRRRIFHKVLVEYVEVYHKEFLKLNGLPDIQDGWHKDFPLETSIPEVPLADIPKRGPVTSQDHIRKDIDSLLVGKNNPEYIKLQTYKQAVVELKNSNENGYVQSELAREILSEPISQELSGLSKVVIFEARLAGKKKRRNKWNLVMRNNNNTFKCFPVYHKCVT